MNGFAKQAAGDSTAIGWVIEVAREQGKRAAVWNPQEGCSPKGEGCRNCWAAREVHMRGRQKGRTGERFGGLTRVTASGRVAFNGLVREIGRDLDKPRRTRAATAFFVCSRSDLFGRETNPALRDRILDVAAAERRHTFLVLTKEPSFMASRLGKSPAMAHIWLGATVWDQASADRARPAMEVLAAAGRRTWVSYEPAIGLVDWTGWCFLDWMVAGGESGAAARTPRADWFRRSRDYCRPRNIAFNFKQWGEDAPGEVEINGGTISFRFRNPWLRYLLPPTKTERGMRLFSERVRYWDDIYWNDIAEKPGAHEAAYRVGVKAAGRTLDGRIWNQVPV